MINSEKSDNIHILAGLFRLRAYEIGAKCVKRIEAVKLKLACHF